MGIGILMLVITAVVVLALVVILGHKDILPWDAVAICSISIMFIGITLTVMYLTQDTVGATADLVKGASTSENSTVLYRTGLSYNEEKAKNPGIDGEITVYDAKETGSEYNEVKEVYLRRRKNLTVYVTHDLERNKPAQSSSTIIFWPMFLK